VPSLAAVAAGRRAAMSAPAASFPSAAVSCGTTTVAAWAGGTPGYSALMMSVPAEAGLIEGDKRGKWTWWRIVPGRLAAVRQALGGT